MPAIVRITSDALDAQAVRALEESVTTSGDGGVVTFQGVVRDNARGKQVRSLEYDAYVEMAEQQMSQIAAEAEA
ncbi:MAG TPA: molybdenum cofactor biosynthesis protein MoaE, partial [Ktedonobacterales bacterium]|nr:molybdenum cofactor biosynthesis protein MoaE [Ktedonobacterales bacterium]